MQHKAAWSFKLLGFIIASLLLIVVNGFLIFMLVSGFTVTITESELQSLLDNSLPASESYDLVDVTYDNAKVSLEEGSPRIDFQMEVDIKIGEAMGRAIAQVEDIIRVVVEEILSERGIEGNPDESINGEQDVNPYSDATIHGLIQVSSEIGYNTKNSVFYLKDPQVENIEVNDVPLAIEDTVNTALEVLTSDFLNEIPVHDFGENGPINWAVRNFMQDIKVENGKVKIDFAL